MSAGKATRSSGHHVPGEKGGEQTRVLILGALALGLSFSWLPPCLLAVVLGCPLPQALFVAWSAFVGIAGLLVLCVLLDRWRS